MRHAISVLLQNEVGALTRMTGLFSTRGYNIDSLNVAPTDDPIVSRVTLVVSGSDWAIAQLNAQLSKLVDVVNIHDMTLGDHFERELVIIKIKLATGGMRFTQFYNCAKCSPTRATLLTGQYDQAVGTQNMEHGATFGEVLRAAGYRTIISGKWHQRPLPTTRGFDRYYGLADGCCNYWNPGIEARPGEPKPGRKRKSPRRWAIRCWAFI